MNLQQKTELASELIANAERQRKDAEATSAHYIGLANAALKPSTPTPRTDEARRIDNGDTHPLLDEMEQMERELAAERARLKEMAAELAHCAGYIASVRTDRQITWHEELYALQTVEWAEGAVEIAEKANAVLEAHDAAMKEDRT